MRGYSLSTKNRGGDGEVVGVPASYRDRDVLGESSGTVAGVIVLS